MENKYRFVSITRYAQLCKITREAVYKRIKSGKTKLLDICEVPVVDLAFNMPSWVYSVVYSLITDRKNSHIVNNAVNILVMNLYEQKSGT